MTPSSHSVQGMDYRVDYGVLQRAAVQVSTLAEASTGAMQGMRLDQVPAALPGTVSAGRAGSLDDDWVSSAQAITKVLTAHGDALATSAKNYQLQETAAAEASDSFFGGIG